MGEVIIAADVAENEFNRMCEAWDVDNDPTGWTIEDKQSFEAIKSPWVKAISKGRVSINEDGNPIVKLIKSTNYPHSEVLLDAEKIDMLAMDNHKEGRSMHKLGALAASMIGVPEVVYAKISPIDKKLIQKAVSLFLA